MFLTLAEVQRIAAEVAAEQNSALEVTVSRAEGDSAYTELILTLTGCSAEPCQTLIGIERDVSEDKLRTMLADHLRQHLDRHHDGSVTLK
jgi:hypothetical protein